MGAAAAKVTNLSVDLNCDLGESYGAYSIGYDADVVPLVTSVNVACGMHAGDPLVMRGTVLLAAENGVAVGAHPGYPDLQGFGRRDMALSADEVYAFTLYQVGALAAFCRAAGVALHHVKPHGQLYNRAARDRATADAIARAVADFDPTLVLVGLAGSCLVVAAEEAGLSVAQEFFADRAYTDAGTLVGRREPGAVIADCNEAVGRTVRAVREGVVRSIAGKDVPVRADTVCVHGDNPRAVSFARALRAGLEDAGIAVRAVQAQV